MKNGEIAKMARLLSKSVLYEVEQTHYDIMGRIIGQMLYRSLNRFAAELEREAGK